MAGQIRLLVFALAYIPHRCRPVPLKRRFAMALASIAATLNDKG